MEAQDKQPPIRWELGEAVYRNSVVVPGLFVIVHAVVIAALHLRRWAGFEPRQTPRRPGSGER